MAVEAGGAMDPGGRSPIKGQIATVDAASNVV